MKMKNIVKQPALLITFVALLALAAQGCGKKSVETSEAQNQYGTSYPAPYPTTPYPYPSGMPGQYTIPVMQYVYQNPYLPFPIQNPADAADYRALSTGIQVQAGDRITIGSGQGGGWGVSRTRWGFWQTCSNQVGLGGSGGRGALWASDGTRTYPIGMGGTHVVQNAGILRIGFDIDQDNQSRCFWIPPSVVLIHQ
jgi:hypothetical protein